MSGAGQGARVRVFISYSRTDTLFAERLKADLRESGATIWIDHESLPPGHPDWQAAIRRGIEASTAFIYIGSPDAAISRNVGAEVQIATEEEQTGHSLAIIPMWARGESWSKCAPFELIRSNYLDARGPKYPDALARLRKSLGLPTHAASTQPAPVAPSAPRYPLPDVPARLASLGFQGANPNGMPAIVPPLVTIPGSPFQMGERNEQHRVEVATFQIGKYPVTVAEYALAVAAKAVREPVGWYNNLTWQTQQQRPDHPVVNVSWRDAVAYTAWLNKVTGQLGWRLPTEAEWEKAARWDPQRGVSRVYPWGDSFDKDRCNSSESGIEMTSPVGSYPASDARRSGASPFGVEEMAGNVWEWTSSLYKSYPYTQNDGREDQKSTENRTARGGSWFNGRRYVRAAYRNGNGPVFANYNLGFRLVRASPGSIT